MFERKLEYIVGKSSIVWRSTASLLLFLNYQLQLI